MSLARLAALLVVVVASWCPSPASAATLVALGDSFSSGEGAPPYVGDTASRGNSCHRSAQAWPAIAARGSGLGFASAACSGAVLDDVMRDGASRREPERRVAQVRRLAGVSGVATVTLTIGGNDVGFGEVLVACATRARCDRRYTAGGRDLIAARIAALGRRLPRAYRAIRSAAPRAQLVVLGYPRLFPRRPRVLTCAAFSAIGPAEQRYLNANTAALDRALRAAAGRAGARYVSVLDAFDDHEITCFGRNQFVNHLTFEGLRPSSGSFHPNGAGQARLAAVALDSVAGARIDPVEVRAGDPVAFRGAGLAPGAPVDVTLQPADREGSRASGVRIEGDWHVDAAGTVVAAFGWPETWYACAGGNECDPRPWAPGQAVVVSLCDDAVCARAQTRIAQARAPFKGAGRRARAPS